MNARTLVRTAVGLVALGGAVWGVISSGRGLRAPPPLASTWSVQERAGCAGEDVALTQSGVYLHAESGGRTWRGKLEGERVSLTTTCGSESAWLTGTWTPTGLSATVRREACGCVGTLLARADER
ncbi:MAG: hypothetical protein ACOZNI_04100 [Myxococcota bacterium]